VLLRSGNIRYNALISDFVLLILDKTRGMVDTYYQIGFVEYDRQLIEGLAQRVAEISKHHREEYLNGDYDADIIELIRYLDAESANATADTEKESGSSSDDCLDTIGADTDQDLAFFHELIQPLEKRCEYW
jgi:hypothetical protein